MCVSARPLLAAAMGLSYTREQPFHLARLANPEAASAASTCGQRPRGSARFLASCTTAPAARLGSEWEAQGDSDTSAIG